MFWIIAATPFFLIGVFCFVVSVLAVPYRRPSETPNDLAVQVVVFMLLAGVFFTIAAKLAS